MAYTHVQHIAYQVPTVAKVFDNTEPPADPTIPTENGIPALPILAIPMPGHVQNDVWYFYNTINNPNTLFPPPTPYDSTADSAYQLWLPYGKKYLSKWIQYLENPDNGSATTRQQGAALVTFLKYHIRWGDWTIPSTNSQGQNVAIITDPASGNPAYTLTNTVAANANVDDNNTTNLDILNANTDAKNRVIRFLNVLYEASQQPVIDHNRTTLKVFTAPEFYFRPEAKVLNSSVYRAYIYEVYKAIKQVLRGTIESMNLDHWLIIPGTIMWHMPVNTTVNNKDVAVDSYFNSCIYIYKTLNHQTSHKIEKSIASHIDGVPYNDWDYGANAPKILPEYEDNYHLNKHLFTIDSIRTGLEICLEHGRYKNLDGSRYGVLAGVYHDRRNDNFGQRYHLQLLISAGMTTNFNSIVLDKDKVFFRNDGLSSQSVTVGTGTEKRYVDARTNTTYPVTVSTDLIALASTVFSLNGDIAFELQPPVNEVLPVNDADRVGGTQYLLSDSMSFTAQNIVIFPTQQI